MQCVINGVEVKVGQRWKDGKGVVHTIKAITYNEGIYPISSTKDEFWTRSGHSSYKGVSKYDLATLVEDAENTPSTKEESYALDQIIEVVEKAFDCTQGDFDFVTKELRKFNDPDFKKYIDLKKKFEDA